MNRALTVMNKLRMLKNIREAKSKPAVKAIIDAASSCCAIILYFDELKRYNWLHLPSRLSIQINKLAAKQKSIHPQREHR